MFGGIYLENDLGMVFPSVGFILRYFHQIGQPHS